MRDLCVQGGKIKGRYGLSTLSVVDFINRITNRNVIQNYPEFIYIREERKLFIIISICLWNSLNSEVINFERGFNVHLTAATINLCLLGTFCFFRNQYMWGKQWLSSVISVIPKREDSSLIWFCITESADLSYTTL